jgi:hypothetical protein
VLRTHLRAVGAFVTPAIPKPILKSVDLGVNMPMLLQVRVGVADVAARAGRTLVNADPDEPLSERLPG